VKVTEGHR